MKLGRYDLTGVLHELRHKRRRTNDPGAPLLTIDEPKVTVLCVTNRPHLVPDVVRMFDAQRWSNRELIIVVNAGESPDLDERPDVSMHQDATASLGSCLNRGVDAATGEIVARFDDDDRYSPDYITGVVDAFRSTDASVVGMCSYFAWLQASDEMILRFPGRSSSYVGRLAGGTISVLTDVARRVRFPDQSLGEDIGFIRAVERSGGRVWAREPQGFLQVRRHDPASHTWSIHDDAFRTDSRVVGSGNDPSLWA